MLPQHGGVPNFNLRISGPFLLALALVLITGSMLTLSFHLNSDPGDLSAQCRTRLSLTITLLLSAFVLLAGTGRWWSPYLWKNRRQKHRSHHRRHRSR